MKGWKRHACAWLLPLHGNNCIHRGKSTAWLEVCLLAVGLSRCMPTAKAEHRYVRHCHPPDYILPSSNYCTPHMSIPCQEGARPARPRGGGGGVWGDTACCH